MSENMPIMNRAAEEVERLQSKIRECEADRDEIEKESIRRGDRLVEAASKIVKLREEIDRQRDEGVRETKKLQAELDKAVLRLDHCRDTLRNIAEGTWSGEFKSNLAGMALRVAFPGYVFTQATGFDGEYTDVTPAMQEVDSKSRMKRIAAMKGGEPERSKHQTPDTVWVLWENAMFNGLFDSPSGAERLRNTRAEYARRIGKEWSHDVAAYQRINDSNQR